MTDVIDKPTTNPISTSRHGDVLIAYDVKTAT